MSPRTRFNARPRLARILVVGLAACLAEDPDGREAMELAAKPTASFSLQVDVNGHDADAPPGPLITTGATITWTYVVSNGGNAAVTNVAVTAGGTAVPCPETMLLPHTSMSCTTEGTAVAGPHRLDAQATARVLGRPSSATDTTWYYGATASISIDKLTNGEDADTPPGPYILVGSAVLWTYVVTNTGEQRLLGVTVTDDQGVEVTCPKTALEVGESMTCTGYGTAVTGPYANKGTATGAPASGAAVTAFDSSHYFGIRPVIALVKRTNSYDVDRPPGPVIPVGEAVQWTYLVTNAGDVRLGQVVVSDNRGVAVTCPKTILEPGESMTCTGSGTAEAGQYANIGSASGLPPSGPAVTDSDESFYYGATPAVQIEKLVNGEDADTAPGPSILVGSSVLWSYIVVNIGDLALDSVIVYDDQGVVVTCPKYYLQPGESMTCTGGGVAKAGLYYNLGQVSALTPAGFVMASDGAYYTGIQLIEPRQLGAPHGLGATASHASPPRAVVASARR